MDSSEDDDVLRLLYPNLFCEFISTPDYVMGEFFHTFLVHHNTQRAHQTISNERIYYDYKFLPKPVIEFPISFEKHFQPLQDQSSYYIQLSATRRAIVKAIHDKELTVVEELAPIYLIELHTLIRLLEYTRSPLVLPITFWWDTPWNVRIFTNNWYEEFAWMQLTLIFVRMINHCWIIAATSAIRLNTMFEKTSQVCPIMFPVELLDSLQLTCKLQHFLDIGLAEWTEKASGNLSKLSFEMCETRCNAFSTILVLLIEMKLGMENVDIVVDDIENPEMFEVFSKPECTCLVCIRILVLFWKAQEYQRLAETNANSDKLYYTKFYAHFILRLLEEHVEYNLEYMKLHKAQLLPVWISDRIHRAYLTAVAIAEEFEESNTVAYYTILPREGNEDQLKIMVPKLEHCWKFEDLPLTAIPLNYMEQTFQFGDSTYLT